MTFGTFGELASIYVSSIVYVGFTQNNLNWPRSM